MAVSTTFKQQCPTCETMISIKEGMAGKKVECTKCKDKFIAKKPDDDPDVNPASKKDKAGAKKATSVVSKTAPAGKRPKVEVDDEDVEEVEDIDVDDDEPAHKNGKAKASSNGKAKKAVETDDEADAGDAKKKDKKKLIIGLALAGVGVVILVVAAVFVLSGGGGGNNPPNPRSGGGPGAKNPDPGNKPPSNPDDNKGPVDVVVVPLTDAERVKLSNLLPGESEHVFRASFKELFEVNSVLRAAVFETPGALDDAELKKKLGFSLLSIDDLICAERFTIPWRFTVLHFKDAIKVDDLKAALKLKAVGKGVGGQEYYKLTEAHPCFSELARFSFGIPNYVRALDPPGDRPTFLRVHNPQTLIISDQAPMEAFLKAKGKFPLRSTPTGPPSPTPPNNTPPAGMTGGTPMPPDGDPMPPPDGPKKKKPRPNPKPGGGGAGVAVPRPGFTNLNAVNEQAQPPGANNPVDDLRGTTWVGTEDAGSKIRLVFSKDPMPTAKIDSEKRKLTGANATLASYAAATPPEITLTDANAGTYELKLEQPTKMVGMCKSPEGNWTVTLQKSAGDASPKDPIPKDPNRGPALIGDTYMTINPALKAILDRMESRGPDGKDKVLLSSATDMGANCLNITIKPPELKYSVPRQPRQFWDVTLLLHETKPHIRYLGTALVQRDTLKYRLRNEITCGVEIDAAGITKQLNERVGKSVAGFLQQLVGHEVRLVASTAAPPAATLDPSPQPLPPGQSPDKKPEEKKLPEPTTSQITVAQQFTMVDFVLDLLLDNSTLSQARSIAALNAGKVRVEIEAASQSLRHQLAAAGQLAGEKGLSHRQMQVPPGRLPPGAFERLRDGDTIRPPLRIDREPKNRISFMAGLLPYLGQQNLLDKIRFDQSWRDPGNWMAGNTVVPQFLDPSYPNFTRQVTFGDLPVDFAATHFVGIAGVGLDAASYKYGDPATKHKRGAFSYDQSATMEEIAVGRGVSNTILMIQVPYDGLTGVSPWIAGGGATVRGVPEKNSIAPFISTNHDKKRGTFAMMADGSVRFIDQSISDEAFKAMSTIAGPAPANLDEQKESNAPVIPASSEKNAKTPDVKTPEQTEPPKKTPEKAEVQKAPNPGKKIDEVKAALQGVWNAKSMVKDGHAPPAEVLKKMRFTFKGEKLLVRGNRDDDSEEAAFYTIDPDKTPMHLDIMPPNEAMPIRCIFEVTKDELKVCFGKERPTAFAAPADSGQALMVFTKQKQ